MTEAKTKPRTDSQLPSGWRYSGLQNIIMEAQPGFACGARSPSGVIQLRMNNVDTRGNFVWDEFIRVPTEVTDVEKYRLEPWDILFNNTNSTELVGKSALFQGYSEPVVYSNHFTRIRVNTECASPGYVAAWLIWQHQLGTFANLCNRWIGQSAVKNDTLFSLEVPLPPTLAEQERIAHILNEKMAVVEKARAAAETRLEAAKAIPAAYLRQVFPKPGQELPDGWRWSRLREISSIISKGTTPTTLGFSYVNIGIPFLRAEDIKGTAVNITEVAFKISPDADEALARSRLLPYDFLITIAGTLGRVGYVPKDAPPVNCNQAVAFARLNTRQIDVNYLVFACQDQRIISPLLTLKAGGALQNLNLQQVSDLEIPLPPRAEQKRITAMLSERMGTAGEIVQAIRYELEIINTLSGALLRRAFTEGM